MLLLTSRAAVEDEFAEGARSQDDTIAALGCAAVGALARVAGSTAINFCTACRCGLGRDGLYERNDIGMASVPSYL